MLVGVTGSSASVDIVGVPEKISKEFRHNIGAPYKLDMLDLILNKIKCTCVAISNKLIHKRVNEQRRQQRLTKLKYFQCGFFNIILFTWNSFRNV